MTYLSPRYVIIAAGGSGSRFNSNLPKQFVELEGVPMLIRTMEAFDQAIPNIRVILVLPAEHVHLWDELGKNYNLEISHEVVTGGETRFNSVKNGLDVIDDEEGFIAIHDGVRPLISKKLIRDAFKAAESNGNAIPVINVNDSLRKVDGDLNMPVNRGDFRVVQTPQCFALSVIKKSFKQSYSPGFTDEASVVESSGEVIHLIQGEPINIKITTPADLLIAEAFYKGSLS